MKQIVTAKIVDTRRLMMAVAMTAIMTSHAFAATLKNESVINANVITVGDVFEDAGQHAGHVLAPAPAPGKSMVLTAFDIDRISKAFSLGWQPKTGQEKLSVTRTGHIIAGETIDTALKNALTQKTGSDRFDLQLFERDISLTLADNYAATIDADIVSYDPVRGDFRATLYAPSRQQAIAKREVSGRLHTTVDVPVLKTPLASGDIITAQDIDYISVRSSDVSPTALLSADKLVGMAPRRNMPAGKMLNTADVVLPVMVKKGQLITLTLKNKVVSLTTQGKALGDGAEGEVVRVINTSSNQIVEGIVTGPQTVAVRAASVGL